MRYIFTIALNDLLISVKEKASFILGLLMPAIMIVILGVAMGGESSATICIDVLDRDQSDLSAQLVRQLDTEMDGSFVLCVYGDPDAPDKCDLPDDLDNWQTTAEDRMKTSDSYGAVLIDDGFADAILAGNPAVVRFQSSDELAAPTLAQQKIDAAISQMNGSLQIANLIVLAADENLRAFDSGYTRDQVFNEALTRADTAWELRPIHIESTKTKDTSTESNGFNQSGPGVASMFVMISGLGLAAVLVYEREQGTLQRLYTLPIPKWQIIGGKLMASYLFELAQYVILIVVGALVGVKWGDSPLGIALIVLIFPLTVAALGLALATVVRTSAQGQGLSIMMSMVLSSLGGAWWPLEIVPDVMKIVGHMSPIAWVMDAFHEIMWYNGGVIDILPMLGVLLLIAAGAFAFGVWRFKYE
jgi:ABC-2 type transport system permease protein